MAIPIEPRSQDGPGAEAAPWARLDAAAKRARLLKVSHQVFARDGLDAPMPAVAAAAGIGVGTLYRQFPSKHELLSALVVEALGEVIAEIEAALTSGSGSWEGLTAFVNAHAERAVADDVLAEAIAATEVDAEVKRLRVRSSAALQALIDGAREERAVRRDAAVLDLRLIIASARAAERVELGAWRRALERGLAGLRAGALRTSK